MLTLPPPHQYCLDYVEKVFIVLMILLPSAVYIYLASKDAEHAQESSSAAPKQAPAQEQSQKYQTPDH
jgi:nitric oxide reductase large subunit